MSEILTNLETIDAAPYISIPSVPSEYRITRRVSRLPPAPSVRVAGPSTEPQRYVYVAVRVGRQKGVYTEWCEAERQVVNHPWPVFKTFSTRFAAEAFVAGWNGAGRHSLPPSSPRPLREHLAMNFPSSVPTSPPSRRQSYHERLLSSASDEFGVLPFSSSSSSASSSSSSSTARPPPQNRSSSYRNSMVKVSSPLRQQVDDEAPKSRPKIQYRVSSVIGIGGLLSPPQSPEDNPAGRRRSVMERERPTKPRTPSETGTWASLSHREFSKPSGLGFLSPPGSPPLSPEKRSPPRAASAASGLWADSRPPQPSPLSPRTSEPDFSSKTSAPKFSRSNLKASGIVMPVAAPRTSQPSLTRRLSQTSLWNGSSASLASTLSGQTLRRASYSPSLSQDRLSSLAETTRRELQLNEEGLLALSTLSPPRPAFMRRTPSSSSLASDSSGNSMTSLTSASSTVTSSFDPCDPILEEEPAFQIPPQIHGEEIVERYTDVQVSCTKSDGDAEGSVESISMKSETTGGLGVLDKKSNKGKGGLFKRFAKALKLERKTMSGHEAGRRPSL